MIFDNDMALAEARDKTWRILDNGDSVKCPCCGQTAKFYRNNITGSMAKCLVLFYQSFGEDYGYIHDVVDPYFARHGGRFAKLRFWGLVEERPITRTDGGSAGWWKVTKLGVDFLKGEAKVLKYVYTYSGEFDEPEGAPVGIDEVSDEKFDLREIMAS
jgi:hypothetical protein